MQSPPAIDALCGAVRADRASSAQLLLLCAGVEMDSHLAEACARGARSLRRRRTSAFGLAMALLPDSHWERDHAVASRCADSA